MITNNVDEALLLSDRIVPMTRGPRATLGAAVEVAMPKPRNAAHLVRDEVAMRVRSHVIEALTTEVRLKPDTYQEVRLKPATTYERYVRHSSVRL
jgi:ABC-type nitrate/sulfonate/bicarbonate transport system ATPase subunit